MRALVGYSTMTSYDDVRKKYFEKRGKGLANKLSSCKIQFYALMAKLNTLQNKRESLIDKNHK